MENKVSIIIPIYNSEKFLKESIQSVLSQSYENLEIIAIDDGSTDNSLQILDQFKDKITIIHQENHGLASALNTGIKAMSGNWFKWFSPDDIMYPKAIETLVNTANSLDDNTIIYSNWDIIDKFGKNLRSFQESNYNKLDPFDFTIRLLSGMQINVNTALIPANFFEKYEFRNLEDSVAVDYDFFLNAAINSSAKFFLVKKPLIQYRIHSNQLSHKKITKTLEFIGKIKQEYLNKLDEKTKIHYVQALDEYNKQKPLSKKTMELGLSMLSKFPQEISDKILMYYLNQIRKNR